MMGTTGDNKGERSLRSGRLGRLARLASVGARSGVGLLTKRNQGAADYAAEVLGNMRGLAAKVGQMLSYVDGIFPEDQRAHYEAALGALRAAAPRSSWAAVSASIESELGAPLGQLFAELEPEPFASASIGQVHRGRLHDGCEVAVKVQHPGITQAMEADLNNARAFEGLVSLVAPRGVDPKAAFAEVARRFREELDYSSFVMLPPSMILLNRLQFGFYSVLARLDVDADYAAIERSFLPCAAPPTAGAVTM